MSAAWRAAWPVLRPMLHALDPERAHDLTLKALATLPMPKPAPDDPRLAVSAFGLRFSNPIGLAAGFDKNGMIAHKAGALGFGFAEIGTLTPNPQRGNPKPRLFRLPEQAAVINRFGFNNLGHAHARAQIRKGCAVIGINIGANKDAADRIADYVAGVHALAEIADYFAINVSSPNTPNLRNLQKPDALSELLTRVLEARDQQAARTGRKSVLLKIAPDLTLHELDDVVRVARDCGIDGMIVSNTTTRRPPAIAAHPHGSETGGLSGRPLFDLSTRMLAETFVRAERQFPLIGVGGIDGADAAIGKIEAGAALIQIYSALAYAGPALVELIKQALLSKLAPGAGWTGMIGRHAADWARP